MNIAILNLKELLKISIRLIVLIFSLIVFCLLLTKRVTIPDKVFQISLNSVLKHTVNYSKVENNLKTQILDGERIIGRTIQVLNFTIQEPEITKDITVEERKKETKDIPIIPTVAITEAVVERNIQESYTNTYGSVKIKNQSNLELTEEMLIPDVELKNKDNIVIFHTHTCESYQPSDDYPYTMTGNFRTTDNNYNMVRVGEELTERLLDKGFKVVHDTTMHDYPSYTGSYDRSYETVQNLLYGKDTEIVIDLHRDAVGDGLSYGPTVKINEESVAQLMFVIGTNGSGLEHPNWVQNLKIAVKIQEKANEIYPRTI